MQGRKRVPVESIVRFLPRPPAPINVGRTLASYAGGVGVLGKEKK